MSDKHGGREWVGVDIDGTLTRSFFHHGSIPAPCSEGVQLLRALKREGYKVLLFTGHMNEDRGELGKNVAMVEAWVAEHGLADLVDRVWPHPKPDVRCIVDDKAARWRGDVDMAVLDVRTAPDWVDAFKVAAKKEA